jgi:8-amino-7-oxononanoate synthase
MNARPITWPTVPKGMDRVRVCLHAGNSREDVDELVNGMVAWAEQVIEESRPKRKRDAVGGVEVGMEYSKL